MNSKTDTIVDFGQVSGVTVEGSVRQLVFGHAILAWKRRLLLFANRVIKINFIQHYTVFSSNT